MKPTLIAVAAALASLCCLPPASALEIPLGGSQSGGGATGTSVGFVDMDRIFQIYPQTSLAKEDYAKQLQKKRDQLADKDAQVNNLKSRISVLESTLKDMGTARSPKSAPTDLSADTTAAAAAPEAPAPDVASSRNLTDMKEKLETQMTELEDMRKQAERDLASFQGQHSQMILGKIYEQLRVLALEEQVTVVVDKASILYGDASIDLTDKLQAKVRGY